jgi:hypothetical protein
VPDFRIEDYSVNDGYISIDIDEFVSEVPSYQHDDVAELLTGHDCNDFCDDIEEDKLIDILEAHDLYILLDVLDDKLSKNIVDSSKLAMFIENFHKIDINDLEKLIR